MLTRLQSLFEQLLGMEKMQFDVFQIRPHLIRLYRDAAGAYHRFNDLRPIDISMLGFETMCLVRYTILLEERLEQYEQRKMPPPGFDHQPEKGSVHDLLNKLTFEVSKRE